MRTVCLALTVAALSSTGCSAYLADSGQNLRRLKDRTEVQARFGPPAATGVTDGQPFEEFTTRRKIADPCWAYSVAWCDAMTLGLAELVFLPLEIYRTGHRSLLGQQLRYTYDADGKVTDIRWDGKPAPYW